MIKLKVTDNKTQKVVIEREWPEVEGEYGFEIGELLNDYINDEWWKDNHVFFSLFIGKV